MWQEYLRPTTVDDALQMLADHGGQARVIAGGTDLVLQLRRGERQASCLVDVSRVDALRGISEAGSFITIGAATTHAEVVRSLLIRERAAVLAQAAAEVGSAQVCNVGTLGGNVVNAQPAADTALALLALGAEVQVVGVDGARWVGLAELYEGPGASRVDSTAELVRAFRFRSPGWEGHGRETCPSGRVPLIGSAYRRLGKCKSIALPVLCAATVVWLSRDASAGSSNPAQGGGSGNPPRAFREQLKFESVAIALGPVAPRPFRAASAEAWLVGRPATAETVAHAATLAQEEANPRDSLLRCSRVYRRAMVAVLVRSTLERAVGTMNNEQ